MSPRTGVLIFEGGHTYKGGRTREGGHTRAPRAAAGDRAAPGDAETPSESPQALLNLVRRWTTLDTLEKFLRRPEIDVVALATDSPGLAREAAEAGARVHLTDRDFHFGRVLCSLVTGWRLDRVVYLGGGAVPLLRPAEMDFLLEALAPGGRIFVANNAQSPDLVALGSAEAVSALAGLATDNETLFALVEAGYRRLLLPDTATTNFDLDTPSDILFLAHEASRLVGRAGGEASGGGARGGGTAGGGAGPREDAGRGTVIRDAAGLGQRAAKGLAGLALDLSVLHRAARVLARTDYPSVTLIGRVSGSTMSHLNSSLLVRLRVFSEERGMKALGRIERGEVRSLLGSIIQELGVEYLIRELEALSDAVFWDTRVVLAHLGRWPDEADRFEADLGRWERVRDPYLRRLCRAASEARLPFVLGGHSVVAGGLRLLVEGLVEDGTVPSPFGSSKNCLPRGG